MTLDTQTEPQIDLPPVAAGSTGHDDIVAAAMQEGELDARLGELAEGDEELTADQLRSALGDVAADLTDEELLAEWKKAQTAETGDATTTDDDEKPETPVAEALKLEGFKLYDAEGKEIADLTKVSAADLLSGKIQIGYNALSKEQRKNLRDLTRVASLGHYNEKVLLDTRGERQQAVQRALAAEAKVTEFGNIQRTWDAALTALVNGNPEPIQRLALAYQQALAQGGNPAPGRPDASPQNAEEDAVGQQFFQEHMAPRAQELATQYGGNAIEIAQYMLWLCEQEGDFLTPEKIQAIMLYEMPAILESKGYSSNGKPAALPQGDGDPRDAKIAALEKRLSGLEAGKANTTTQRLREKKKAPPAGGGSTPGAVSVPEMKTREDMKRFLHGDE